MTVSSVLQPVLKPAVQSALGNGAGEYVPPATIIDAPTSVTYIEETNPPSFNMNLTYEGAGAVEVGDEPIKRYNGAGTEYVGDPLDAIPPSQPLGGFGDSAVADPSLGYVQYRIRRSDGLGGYIYSDWSSSSEGAYTIGDVVDPVFTSPTTGTVEEGVTLSFNVTTDEATTKTIIGGAQQADFELVTGGTPATTHVLRWASNGTETPGAFEVQIEAEDAVGNTAQQTITITCEASVPDPVPTYLTTLPGAGAGNGGTGQVQTWTGVNLSAATRLAALFARNYTGPASTSLVITPSGGSDINAVEHHDSTGGAVYLADLSGATGSLASCTVVLTMASNAFGGRWIHLWDIPTDVDLVAAAGSLAVGTGLSSATLDIETEDGGFVLAVYGATTSSNPGGTDLAQWGGDLTMTRRSNFDSGGAALDSGADAVGTPASLTTTITVDYAALTVNNPRIVAASFR